ncbi:MAG TPA: S53 family peptidase [Edaphobacter sp.]|jgi:subtilase family serine protease|nr:S53 family peptidase [Edaphobacter sp.]
MIRARKSISLTTLAVCIGLTSLVTAQTSHSPSRIRESINNSRRFIVSGNIRPEATAENDRGVVSDSMELPHLQLVLQRSPEQQKAFDQLLADQANPQSANFHHWLTAAEVGEQFGPSVEDLGRITDWLTAEGFNVVSVDPAGTVIEFSGTAGAVRNTFRTTIHHMMVNGQVHFGNYSDPELPSALAGIVAGVASLHNFMPHAQSMLKRTSGLPAATQGNGGNGLNYLSAADVAAVYNFNPLYKSGISGKGQTIVVIEDTDLFSQTDWVTFRKAFGLARAYPSGTLTQVHPTGPSTCGAPGVNGDDGEAAIDVEWASAAAPNAAIVNAACANTTQFGGFIALLNIFSGPASGIPQVVSISYGEAEASDGATENLFINNLYALGAAEGVSIFVSSGDEGAASADANRVRATHGIGISGFASTPNNVAVGGTDTSVFFSGTTDQYFSTTNGPNFQTALSYFPEVPWNDSCAGTLVTQFLGFATPYGPNGTCNQTNNNFETTASGSGGPSGCATGTASTRSVVSGTCAGYPKPSWQAGVFGNPADGVRDIPDVSLFASNGFLGVYYDVCWSDTTRGGSVCGSDPSLWAGFGGTSVSSPIWAGIQALVNQRTGERQGNPNPVLYTIGNSQYGTTGAPTCNSTLGNAVGPSCVFYDVTLGDMDVPCSGAFNCFLGGGAIGVLSVSNSVYQPAYPATAGWDFATGLGTTNATNLVMASVWPTAPKD